jgi:hypothetical protein
LLCLPKAVGANRRFDNEEHAQMLASSMRGNNTKYPDQRYQSKSPAERPGLCFVCRRQLGRTEVHTARISRLSTLFWH